MLIIIYNKLANANLGFLDLIDDEDIDLCIADLDHNLLLEKIINIIIMYKRKNKKSKFCLYRECKTRPKFNYKGKKLRLYCKKHSLINMVDVDHHHCITKVEECYKIPHFNYKGQNKGLYCMKHKDDDMIDVIHKRCITDIEYCDKQSAFNYKGKKVGLYCAKHKKDNMVDVINKTCTTDIEECDIQASYNYKGKKSGLYCVKHKLTDMIDIKNKKCITDIEECNIIPSFNYKGENNGLYCKKHKLDDMVDVTHRKCITNIEDCDKQSNFNYEGEKIGLYCKKHKLENMIDIKHKKCKTDLCDVQIANKQYKGYCSRCFIFMFPDDKHARNYKTKEQLMINFILEKFPISDYDWILDKKVEGGCSKRRPDMLLDLGNKVLIIECDEYSHRNYDCSCENKRVMEISQDLNHRPIIFIRFNPDSYTNKDDKKINSCFTINKLGVCVVNKKQQKSWNERLNNLENTIKYWIENDSDKTVESVYLYFDEIDT
jgi:hypothetical protein